MGCWFKNNRRIIGIASTLKLSREPTVITKQLLHLIELQHLRCFFIGLTKLNYQCVNIEQRIERHDSYYLELR